MNQTAVIIFGLAYILGLLCSAVAWGRSGVLALALLLAIATMVREFFTRKQRQAQMKPRRQKVEAKTTANLEVEVEQTSPTSFSRSRTGAPPPYSPPIPETVWLFAGLIAVAASLYLQIRTPAPAPNDISQLITDNDAPELIITVRGQVTTPPHLTRSGRAQFWLKAAQVNEIMGNDQPIKVSRDVSGKLYITVPLLQATGLHPGAAIAVTGNLYKPQPPSNPGAFDFRAYLARQGAFAGLQGRYLTPVKSTSGQRWGWWAIRQRIVRAQTRALGIPKGPVVSAMVLGRRAVDLPYDVRDQFVQVGLAHILAASGFHVSLVLGVVLALTRTVTPRQRLTIGAVALLVYVGLTGASPSVLRAALMGFAALIGFATNRQIRPLSVLVGVAVALLLWNPLWIWDLGFQFSFLATLGLLVSVPPILKRLDWMPPAIASLFAVPLAASIWTVPLQLYVFNVVSPYSILVNVITVPLVAGITLGGLFSGMVALFWPTGGTALSAFLEYPVEALLALVRFFSQRPGNSMAVGSISEFQLIALYSLLGFVLLIGRYREARRQDYSTSLGLFSGILHPATIALTLALAIAVVPIWYNQASQFQATVLATSGEPILVIQDRGNITLVNSGGQDTARYTVLPFLQKQGVNSIDFSISTHSRLGLSIGWPIILEKLPVQIFYDNPASKQAYYVSSVAIQKSIESRQGIYLPLTVEESLELGSIEIELIDAEAPIVEFFIGDLKWMLLGDVNIDNQIKLLQAEIISPTQVLWWSGNRLDPKMLRVLQPKIAIASSNTIDPETLELLRERKTQVFWTGRDGAVQWTPTAGFETTLHSDQTDGSFL
ncbi:ComEC/Rec2 family competence protein [Capilliphycus salinus ALCB114379]|uniref:ComEC/Rec2 family competence protein n=1 Tax=Capilliphycus salinus TaxID=2768948 RepID=UPI0039A76391